MLVILDRILICHIIMNLFLYQGFFKRTTRQNPGLQIYQFVTYTSKIETRFSFLAATSRT